MLTCVTKNPLCYRTADHTCSKHVLLCVSWGSPRDTKDHKAGCCAEATRKGCCFGAMTLTQRLHGLQCNKPYCVEAFLSPGLKAGEEKVAMEVERLMTLKRMSYIAQMLHCVSSDCFAPSKRRDHCATTMAGCRQRAIFGCKSGAAQPGELAWHDHPAGAVAGQLRGLGKAQRGTCHQGRLDQVQFL